MANMFVRYAGFFYEYRVQVEIIHLAYIMCNVVFSINTGVWLRGFMVKCDIL